MFVIIAIIHVYHDMHGHGYVFATLSFCKCYFLFVIIQWDIEEFRPYDFQAFQAFYYRYCFHCQSEIRTQINFRFKSFHINASDSDVKKKEKKKIVHKLFKKPS